MYIFKDIHYVNIKDRFLKRSFFDFNYFENLSKAFWTFSISV